MARPCRAATESTAAQPLLFLRPRDGMNAATDPAVPCGRVGRVRTPRTAQRPRDRVSRGRPSSIRDEGRGSACADAAPVLDVEDRPVVDADDELRAGRRPVEEARAPGASLAQRTSV